MNKLKIALCLCIVSFTFYAQAQQTPTNPNANQKTKNILNYLHNLKGNGILSGQESMYWNWQNQTPSIATQDQYIHNLTGKYPAVYSSDFGDFQINDYQTNEAECNAVRDDVVNAIRAYAGRGALITMSYHMRPPTVGVCADYNEIRNPQDDNGNFITLTDAQIDQITTPGTAQYNATIERFDQIAAYFKELENEDITVLWRPFHEMNGGWFWWGQLTPSKYIDLWNMMYDRLTNYHGCNNLLWVWSVNYYNQDQNPGVYYPGDSRVDVLGADIYTDPFHGGAYAQYIYDDLNTWGGGKPIAFTENGTMPDVNTIKNTMPNMVYWLTWFTHYDSNYNSNSLYQSNYGNPYTITLDELPDFDNTCPPTGTPCNDGNPNTTNDQEDGNCNCVGTPIQSDCELISNGNFDNDTSAWGSWNCTPSASGGTANITSINAGANAWDAGFSQSGVTLEQGKTYTITFRAKADNNRSFDLKVGLSVAPWTSYLYETVNLGTSMQTYEYPFTMNNTTNTNASLEFLIGNNSSNVYIDNVSFKADDCGDNNCPTAGTPCNDNNSATYNDVEDGNCNCVGTPCPAAGTTCDDGNATTYNDVEDGNCNCAGTPCPAAGTTCDDGNVTTYNDVEDGFCNCAGTPCPTAGTTCDDDNATTYNDVEDGFCNCVGTPCPAAGTSCDDDNPNTTNDLEDGFCNCAGTPVQNNDCELITNGGFDSDVSNWNSWNCNPYSVNGVANVTTINSGANPWNAGFSQSGATLEQGKTYTITFRARASNNRSMVFKSGLSVSPWTSYLYETVNLSSNMQTYTYTLTMNSPTNTNVSFEFLVGSSSWNVYIDYVSVEENDCSNCPPAGTACDDDNPNTQNDIEDGDCNCAGTPIPTNCNLITNGTFDTDLIPWSSWGCDPYQSNGWAYIGGLEQPGSNAWDAGFSHLNLLLEQGKTYTISFDAYGDNRNFDVKIGLGVAPYNSYHYETVSVNWTGQTFTTTFTMTAPTTTQGALEFFLGGISGDVALDNISFNESGCGNKQDLDITHQIQLFPNPANQNIQLSYEISENTQADIQVYDAFGKLVKRIADVELLAGSPTQVEVSQLPAGVYFCTLQSDKWQAVKKFVIAR